MFTNQLTAVGIDFYAKRRLDRELNSCRVLRPFLNNIKDNCHSFLSIFGSFEYSIFVAQSIKLGKWDGNMD